MTGQSAEVVVIGGGIAGSALATVLARNGIEVLVLERQSRYRDKVRGEVLFCWGVDEMLRMDLEKPLLDAGGGYVSRLVPYDEMFDPSEAEVSALQLDQLIPGVPGVLDIGHPQACEALIRAAVGAGAAVLRGVDDIDVRTGTTLGVRYKHRGVTQEVSCRLVIGADGRESTVRRQLGIELTQTTPRTVMGGMLVEGLHEWPAQQASIGTEDDLYYSIFPRPGGQARLYLLHDITQKGRFAGPQRQADFLAAYRLRCIPHSEMFISARPAGPCAFYPMTDSWTNHPYAPGVLLIGDAAGWSDPIIGQGLSVAMRDARIVADILCSTNDWGPASIASYGHERHERMRRLRITAHVVTNLRATFGPHGTARRRTYNALTPTDAVIAGPITAGCIGPDKAPAESFEQSTIDRILALH